MAIVTSMSALPSMPGANIATYIHWRCAHMMDSMMSCASNGALQLSSVRRCSFRRGERFLLLMVPDWTPSTV